MCYEKYISFVCGCRDVESGLCEYAALTDNPFVLKLNCENYNADHIVSNNACSLRFYCAKSRDADYLDDLWRRGEYSTRAFNRIEELQKGLKAMAESAQRANVPQHIRNSHPHWNKMSLELDVQLPRRDEHLQACAILKHHINEVMRFYDAYGKPNTPDQRFSQTPSFVDTYGRRFETTARSTAIDASRSATPNRFPAGDTVPVQPWNSALVNIHGTLAQARGRSKHVPKQDAPVRRARKSASPAKAEMEQDTGTVRRSARINKRKVNYGESGGSSPARATSPGESDVSGFNPSNKSETPESPEISQPKRKPPRPSLQSQNSDLAGRYMSGQGNSLASKLIEFREREGRVSSSANARLDYEVPTFPSRVEEGRTSIYQVPASFQSQQGYHIAQTYGNTNSVPSSRPPTRHGPPSQLAYGDLDINRLTQRPPAMPTFLPLQQPRPLPSLSAALPANVGQISQPRNNLYAQRPSQRFAQQYGLQYGPSNINAAAQQYGHSNVNAPVRYQHSGWPVSMPVQPILAAPTEASNYPNLYDLNVPQSRVNGMTGAAPPHYDQSTPEGIPPESQYDLMRRSFGANADLPSPDVTNISPTTDPKKRKQPVSSPLLPSNKRLRLSLPDDEVPNNNRADSPQVHNQALPMSSPSKMQSQGRTLNAGLPQDQDNPPPSPAPNFAPEAIMYNPSLAEAQLEDPAGELPYIDLSLPSSVIQGKDLEYGDYGGYGGYRDNDYYDDDLIFGPAKEPFDRL